MNTPETTAQAAADVRETATSPVITEAAKSPILQGGEIHDRMLGGAIGALLIYGILRIFHLQLGEGQALAVGAAGANLGTMIGAKIPEAYRGWLQALFMLGAALLGLNVGAPS